MSVPKTLLCKALFCPFGIGTGSMVPLTTFCFHERENSTILPFMKTIVIANQKGGSGKSTSTVHLAVAAEMSGDGPVVLSDTDPQGSTVDWFNQRRKAGLDTPRYAPLGLPALPDY